ncbi:Hypothetical predicted protein [Xyrichtys novacula]|uniref:Uncharacterized protein n=1 Tax=Xyrichtys novacula TaxID=13765 RepID=A0AAV1EZ90_XYRNO|nr:Hypothetical predicted protein [Xyrichtys novacula]
MEISLTGGTEANIQAFVKVHAQLRGTKGQISGSGLQLCASGAPAEPASTTPCRDQRHPRTVKCHGTEEGEGMGAKKEREEAKTKTCFIMVKMGERRARRRYTESDHAHSPTVSGENTSHNDFNSSTSAANPLIVSVFEIWSHPVLIPKATSGLNRVNEAQKPGTQKTLLRFGVD